MRCPLPRYYFCHVVFALLIAGATTLVFWWPLGLIVSAAFGLGIGAGFYGGREFTQWEQGGGAGLPFDWPGLVAPVLICVAMVLLYKVLT